MPRNSANPKAEEARARKEQQKQDKECREAKAKEDAQWADEGKQGKAAKKKLEEEKKRQEAAQKKAEVEKMKQQEEKEMAAISKKGLKGPKGPEGAPPKVTRAELEKMKEEEAKRQAEADKERKKAASRVQDAAEYERLVGVANTNRLESAVDARNLDEAVSQLSAATIEEQAALDKHPEKRLKAAFKAFEESELPRLREESPGLTLTQYKDMVWKIWKKSPQNPMNQTGGR